MALQNHLSLIFKSTEIHESTRTTKYFDTDLYCKFKSEEEIISIETICEYLDKNELEDTSRILKLSYKYLIDQWSWPDPSESKPKNKHFIL